MRVIALCSIVLAVAGCGEDIRDCYASCDKLFGDGEGQCAIAVPGRTASEMTNDCVATCEGALAHSGEMGNYNPNKRSSGADEITIENEQQASAWMDCIAETACVDLKTNYCAPTTNF